MFYLFTVIYGSFIVQFFHSSMLKCAVHVLRWRDTWVLRIPRCEHITPGLKSLHWLPVEKRIVFKLCLLVYKTRHCLAPLYLCGLLLLYAPARQLRSGCRNLMVVPRARTQTYGNRLFSVAASVQWNQHPYCIRRQESMAAFKVSLKTHLFRISYGI